MRFRRTHIDEIFPVLATLKTYNGSLFKADAISGFTVAVMLIPQGMAYALIAGLPPEYGLYASLVPLIIYSFLGTSRHLAVGPVALIALLVASAVSPLASTPEEYIALSVLLALMVGGIQFLFGLMRLGFLVNLLSHPVLSGFISAAAIVIGFSQLHHLLGIESVSGNLHEIIYGVMLQVGDVNYQTLLIGIFAIGLIWLFKKRVPSFPGSLAVVFIGIMVVWLAGLDRFGIAIVGAIPAGLPEFQVPLLSMNQITALFPMAMAISLVAYMEAIAVAKAIQQKDKSYSINPDKELIALGASNIAGSLFQSFPTTGSFSRTAVAYDTGGKTTLSSLYGAIIIGVTLLFLTPLFYYLPNAILAAIIMMAVYGLVEVEQFRKLWRLKHYDRYMFLATFAGTLFIGIEEGILLGVTLSVIMLVYRSARPHHTILGRIPETNIYRNVDRYETEQEKEFLVFRFDAPIHFANAEYFKDKIGELIRHNPDTSCLILDLNGVNDIDSTGLDELFKLKKEMDKESIRLHLAEVKSPVRDLIRRKSDHDDDWRFYMDVDSAVIAASANESEQSRIWLDK
ncbi:MAG: solute carrier family 26 protein [Balneolaceae bacterium]|nr:solute carrier family 26 protein [Balneolaceae bacterium]MCH8548773.1 solute carrier family 26 protein [Balneolaceae bacterium]